MPGQTIERRGQPKHFRYYQSGQEIADKATIEYINSLKIPPAWENVQISKNRSAKILATGMDKAGRLQYIYHPNFRRRQEQEKFERILRFANALPKMRRITARHLKRNRLDRQKVLACVLRLMDQAYFRVGNDVYAKENDSYGLTTIRSKHVSVKADTITFDFVGKSGKRQVRSITDKKLARIVRKLDDLPGYEVFKYYDETGELKDVKSSDVNEYIKEIMGEEFTAKDFRTWGGTLLASAELAKIEEPPTNQRERQKLVTACVKKVARRLGNTPAVTRSSYIDPRVIEAFKDNKLSEIYQTVKDIDKQTYLSGEERCVLKLIEKVSNS